jgi:hypothetical protein
LKSNQIYVDLYPTSRLFTGLKRPGIESTGTRPCAKAQVRFGSGLCYTKYLT